MSKGTHIPLDVESCAKLGMEYCLENFGHVVSSEEFLWLKQRMLDTFNESLLSCDDDVCDAVLIDIRFFQFLLQHAHLILLNYRVEKSKAIVEVGRDSAPIIWPDWSAKSSFDAVFGSPFTGLDKRVKNFLRTYRDTWQNNQGSMIWKAKKMTLSRNTVVALGISHSTQLLIQEDDGSFGIFSDLYPYEIFGNTHSVSHDFLQRATTQYVEPLWRSYKDGLKCLGLNTKDNTPFKAYRERLGYVNGACEVLKRKFGTDLFRNIETIRTIGNSSAIRRLASFVGFRSGVEVEAFSHGYEQGLFPWPEVGNRYVSATRFVLPTESIRDTYRENFSSDPLLKRLPTAFTTQKSSQLYAITKERIKSTETSPSTDVMVIGWPFNSLRYSGGCYWYTQLDLQYRLVLALKKFGLSVIYKVHPDRINEACRIFEGIADEVNTGQVEDVWSKARVFLFTSPVSTATGFLAFTNRTMVLIDHPNLIWNQVGKERLRTRCKIVPADLSENGRVHFCENQLYRAVTEDHIISDEFINQYR